MWRTEEDGRERMERRRRGQEETERERERQKKGNNSDFKRKTEGKEPDGRK